MENVVVSMGGSIIAPETIDPVHVGAIAGMLKRVCEQVKVYVIVGGGRTARKYIDAARELCADEAALDTLGICATRLNAMLLITAIGEKAFSQVPESVSEAAGIGRNRRRIVVMGGTTPGHSTDYVGAELASILEDARFVNATNVDYVYTRDPKKHADAERLEELTIDRLIEINGGTAWNSAGANAVMDGPACALIKRHRIPTSVVNGSDMETLENVILGKPFKGTKIIV